MTKNRKWVLAAVCLTVVLSAFYACKTRKPVTAASAPTPSRILVFARTKGFYHESIPTGLATFQELGREAGITVDTTRDAAYFVTDSLRNYRAVIFLNTTMNVLNPDQQVAFERYIQAGGGYMGVHAATDTEYEWPWYNKLVGAYFLSHPKSQEATVVIKDKTHPATAHLPEQWRRFDEWYNFKNLQPGLNVIAALDESSYEGGANGDNHPIAWYHEFDGGRAFYTGMGHTKESYADPLFRRHLLGGLQYAMGTGAPLDYSKSYAVKSPEDNRFVKTVLTNDLNEPMELTVAPDGRVFFTERSGKLYLYEPQTNKTRLLREFPVKAVDKYLNGLIGITLDPDFATNNYIYFFYSSNTGDQYHQNISRFRINPDNSLDTASEQVIIKVPIDLEVSAHTGGSLAWDKQKNLYIATGDNTVPFESHGYAPIDERTGRIVYDAQRSAGNPNDLRGKILRIHPEPDGSYTIPDGNLFPKGTAGTRPEIYVMGCRNPYRISVDTATGFLYWGEIGPDAGTDSRHGPRGYDEFNQARTAGNYGWPYFVGNNIAYHDSDFATRAIGDPFIAANPVNASPNNTGLQALPPARQPLIWYPYSRSAEFPDLGEGGRCAMGGPVYHYNAAHPNANKIPEYYDGAFFIYDWMRNWVFAVRLDEQGNYKRMEPFMSTNGDFRRPVDLEFGPDGALYMLEYGSVYGIDNEDARLVRIEYNGGNRAPVAQASTRDTIGLAPYRVTLNSARSYDFDDDALKYEWSVLKQNGTSLQPVGAPYTAAAPVHTFAENGIYQAVLKVTDPAGLASTDTVEIKVGNTLPLVKIEPQGGNTTFFFPKTTALKYAVSVQDKEEAQINPADIKVNLRYIPRVASATAVIGHQQLDENFNLGRTLVASSDCKACHQLNAKSVGPSFTDVAKKYKGNKSAIGYLASKIITGGGGVWGEHAMSAHPQLSKEDASEMAKYVLSVGQEADVQALPATGTLYLDQHAETPGQGRYLLTASYTDKGGALVPLTGRTQLLLRPALVQAEEADRLYRINRNDWGLGNAHHGSWLMLRGIDLSEVTGLTYRYGSAGRNGAIEVHLDSAKGPVISTFALAPTASWSNGKEGQAPVQPQTGRHDLYFVFTTTDVPNRDLANLDWIRFEGGTEATPPKTPVKAVVNKPLEKAPPSRSDTKKTTAAKPAAAAPARLDGRVLVAKSDCATCHQPTEEMIGPSFRRIAYRYPNTGASAQRLAVKIIKGGAGVWGQVPMTPHLKLSKAEAEAMARYVLSFRKK
ncbi:MAG TPA: ThuA domain-containing protein [Chitinophagaceae bacterium]|jgi:cytochrome c|nr:ThuA domain-containing protein [Chitinophagaceae bacterium]